MDAVLLSRLQFAVAVFFHFIFVPLTLGLSFLIAWMETRYAKTGDEQWKRQAQFWGKLFLINFTLGVVTGITLEFQFGTNWSRYSEYVGDIFGSLLAIEATVAFFLESTFLAVWHFGWKKLSPKAHCVSAWLVFIGGNISALWIIIANGFMQHPLGYVLQNGRAELADFWSVVFNPYALGMFAHTIITAWLLAGFFVLGIAAWHLVRKSHAAFFSRAFKMVAPFTLIMAILVGVSGHFQGENVFKFQPAKLAAMEGHWETTKNAPFYLLAVPNEAAEENAVQALKINGLLSFIAAGDSKAEIKGLKDFPKEQRPPVAPTFWSFRLMIAMGGIFILLALWSTMLRNKTDQTNKLFKILPWAIPLPYIAIALGWAVAEIGRQPWIVYNLLMTKDAVSPVPAANIAISLGGFIAVYSLLGILDIFLLIKYARKGPVEE